MPRTVMVVTGLGGYKEDSSIAQYGGTDGAFRTG
jgi:hypothetical protein